ILFFPFLRLSSPRSTLFPYTTLFRSDHYRQQLIVLEKRRDEMTAKEEQLKQAEQASFIQPYEQQWLGSKEQVQQREVLLKQKMADLRAAQAEFEQAECLYEKEIQQEEQREQLKRQAQQLEAWLPTVRELSKKEHDVSQLFQQLQRAKQDLENEDTKIRSVQTKRD